MDKNSRVNLSYQCEIGDILNRVSEDVAEIREKLVSSVERLSSLENELVEDLDKLVSAEEKFDSVRSSLSKVATLSADTLGILRGYMEMLAKMDQEKKQNEQIELRKEIIRELKPKIEAEYVPQINALAEEVRKLRGPSKLQKSSTSSKKSKPAKKKK